MLSILALKHLEIPGEARRLSAMLQLMLKHHTIDIPNTGSMSIVTTQYHKTGYLWCGHISHLIFIGPVMVKTWKIWGITSNLANRLWYKFDSGLQHEVECLFLYLSDNVYLHQWHTHISDHQSPDSTWYTPGWHSPLDNVPAGCHSPLGAVQSSVLLTNSIDKSSHL